MKVVMFILFVAGSLSAEVIDPQALSLQNLKEMEISLNISSERDTELLKDEIKTIEKMAPQEEIQASPLKCHQVFFLKEIDLPSK